MVAYTCRCTHADFASRQKKRNSFCSFATLLLLCQNNANSVCHCPKIVYISPSTDRSGVERRRDHFLFFFANVWLWCCCFFVHWIATRHWNGVLPIEKKNGLCGAVFTLNKKQICWSKSCYFHKSLHNNSHSRTDPIHTFLCCFISCRCRDMAWKPLLISNQMLFLGTPPNMK